MLVPGRHRLLEQIYEISEVLSTLDLMAMEPPVKSDENQMMTSKNKNDMH